MGRVRAHRAIGVLDEIVLSLIAERRRLAKPPDDLLSMLIAARDETGTERMSDQQLRDELLTLILAGHETTANALSWTFYLLAQHPEVEQHLAREVDEVTGGAPLRLEDLSSLTYTEAVLKESMRLYPPAWIIERQALSSDTVGGYEIGADCIVAISPWILHRDPAHYPNPKRFDPQRFSAEACAQRRKHAYLPFGAGPRTCIGNAFAMMEAKIVLATLAGRFVVKTRPGLRVDPDPGVTLRPRKRILVRLQKRSTAANS